MERRGTSRRTRAWNREPARVRDRSCMKGATETVETAKIGVTSRFARSMGFEGVEWNGQVRYHVHYRHRRLTRDP